MSELLKVSEGNLLSPQVKISSSPARNRVKETAEAIKLEQVGSPLEACRWLLCALSRTDTPAIQEHTNEIQSLLDTICSASQTQTQATAPSVASQGAENILQTITSLNTKCPGLVRGNVVDLITQGLVRSKYVNPPRLIG